MLQFRPKTVSILILNLPGTKIFLYLLLKWCTKLDHFNNNIFVLQSKGLCCNTCKIDFWIIQFSWELDAQYLEDTVGSYTLLRIWMHNFLAYFNFICHFENGLNLNLSFQGFEILEYLNKPKSKFHPKLVLWLGSIYYFSLFININNVFSFFSFFAIK